MFSGIDEVYINLSKFNNMYFEDDYSTSFWDPLIHLDTLCVSMMVHIREGLYGEDMTNCLMLIFNYPKLESVSDLISFSEWIMDKIKTRDIGFVKIPSAFEEREIKMSIESPKKEVFINHPLEKKKEVKAIYWEEIKMNEQEDLFSEQP